MDRVDTLYTFYNTQYVVRHAEFGQSFFEIFRTYAVIDFQHLILRFFSFEPCLNQNRDYPVA